MSGPNFVVTSRRVVTPTGVRPASVVVRGGVIASVEDVPLAAGGEALNFGGSVVMPGLIDTHVHVNEPGRTDWEGFETATRAAAAGGVTTIFDMPLNSVPPTVSVAALSEKASAASGKCFIDVGFWGGVVPGNLAELAGMADLGVPGFKCFLVPSGVPEFDDVSEHDLREALAEIARIGAVLLVHAEHPGWITTAATGDPRRYATYLATRPARAEDEAVALLARLCRETGARIHIVHLSSATALGEIESAQAAGLSLSAETCPHYLFFAAEDVPDGATEFKCAPPIRDRSNRNPLWDGLAGGAIEMVVSDHSPSPPEMKSRETGDFLSAWGGISSLQLRLPAVWTAARERGHTVEQLAGWLCTAPAQLGGVANRKGAIALGFDADFVVWDPEAAFEVRPDSIHHRHKLTPYLGRTLSGVVEATFLAGEKIFENGRFIGMPRGRILWTAAGAGP
ncbi:MAG TPA: allantoinase AllB [Thermoanaerobaculia bacterium]|nr:allantoinase AllB [Thermoanaerobaculia bacterium]